MMPVGLCAVLWFIVYELAPGREGGGRRAAQRWLDDCSSQHAVSRTLGPTRSPPAHEAVESNT
jgi:hypothetical protein